MDVLKSLKPWQLVVLMAVLLGATGVTYGVYTLISGSGQVALEGDQRGKKVSGPLAGVCGS